MRVVFSLPVVLGLLFASSPLEVRADSSGTRKDVLRLVNDDQSRPSTERQAHDHQKGEAEKTNPKNLPSLRDLGLNLDSSEIVKQNDLDSLSVQPWTPGRGAVGVKVEVTW